MLRKRDFSNICLLILPIIYIIIYELYLFKPYLKYIEFITASVMIFFVFLAIVLLGFRKNKQDMLQKNIMSMILTYIIMFFAVSYGAGLIFGFLKNSYSLSFYSIIDNIFAPILIIVCTEIFRYTFIRANKDKIGYVKVMTFVLILLEFTLSIKLSAFASFENIFRMVTSTALPIIMKNILLSYLSYYAGYQTTLLYRLFIDVYVFVLPIIPDLGEYINSMLGIGFPFIIYVYASRIIDEYLNGIEHSFEIRRFGPVDVVAISVIGCLTLLCSRLFPWYVIGVATHSMSPQISRGDVVVVKKIEDEKELKKGIVISFYQNNREIVHRIVDFDEVDGKKCYITKGDANSTNDMGCLSISEINGRVLTNVPYLAYPKIFLSEFLSKEK